MPCTFSSLSLSLSLFPFFFVSLSVSFSFISLSLFLSKVESRKSKVNMVKIYNWAYFKRFIFRLSSVLE